MNYEKIIAAILAGEKITEAQMECACNEARAQIDGAYEATYEPTKKLREREIFRDRRQFAEDWKSAWLDYEETFLYA